MGARVHFNTFKHCMAEAVTGVPWSTVMSLSLFSAQGVGNVTICQTANCLCAISKCTFYVLFCFGPFLYFFKIQGLPPPRPPFSVLTRKSLSCVHVQTYCNFFSVQAALLSAQPCLRNPRFLVSRLLYRVCNLCSCLLGHLHLAYNKV